MVVADNLAVELVSTLDTEVEDSFEGDIVNSRDMEVVDSLA